MELNILIVANESEQKDFICNLIRETIQDVNIQTAPEKDASTILENERVDILILIVNNAEEFVKDNEGEYELIIIAARNEKRTTDMKEVTYISNPIDPTEFKAILFDTVEKRKEAVSKKEQAISSFVKDESYLNNKLTINHQQGIKFISLKDIIYLKADNSYTTVVLPNGEKVISSKPISKFEAKLNPLWFFRIHKSYIINMYHFKEYISKDGDVAVMNNGERIYISRYRVNDFISLIQRISGELKI